MTDIVVGVDGSAPSQRALEWALQEARLRGYATVTLVHGYRSPGTRRPYAYSDPYLSAAAVTQIAEQERQWREQQEQAVRRHAEALVERALGTTGAASDGIVVKRVIVARNPATSLVETSRDADLLVVGSRGRGGVKGLLLGSVSQQCMHHARCPVVVIR